jgi:hypothetical protein
VQSKAPAGSEARSAALLDYLLGDSK